MARGLCVGVTRARDAEATRARVEAFGRAAGEALHLPVSFHVAGDYRGLVAALEQGAVHLAWVPPVAAIDALRTDAIRPLAVAVRNNATSYSAALFSAAPGPIQSLADVVGVRAAWVDRQSASGYVFVRAALRQRGMSLVDAFREDLFLRGHAEVTRAVLGGAAEVGATYFSYHPGTRELADAGWRQVADDASVRILLEAGPIPSDFIAAHAGMAAADVAVLEAGLVDAKPAILHRLARELTGAGAFARPSHAHAGLIRSAALALGPPSRPGAGGPPSSGR